MDTPQAAEADTSARTFCPPESRRFVLVSAILASSMGFIDGSVVSLAMPAIRADLGASLVDAQWINNAYMLFLSALILAGGAAGDVFGVRNVLAAGIAVFMATSALCALAPDGETLILLRAAQGLGAAFMVPGSLAIIAKSYPAGERGRAIGIWAAASSVTTAMGPFVGGMVLTFGADWMWRFIFAINVPIGLIALSMILTRVPADRPRERRRLDTPGALLATAGLGLVAWGLTAFGLPQGQRALPPAAWVGIGVAILAVFIAWEARARAPMVKLGLFGSPAFSGANLYTLILFLAFGAVLFFLPMTVITAWGAAEWEASLLFLPVSFFIATLSSRTGRLADRFGPRRFLTAGATLVGLSFAGLAATMPLMMLWEVTFPILVVMGLGMGTLVSPLSAAAMAAAPDEDSGLASGVNNAVARAGQLMAVAALGALAGIVYNAMVAGTTVGVEFGASPEAPLAPALEAVRIEAANRAFQAIAGTASGLCLLAAVLALATQPSRRKQDAMAPAAGE